jgi:DMSO reductase anchor subunit
MPVVNTKTLRVSNADAAPRVLDTPGTHHGKIRREVGVLAAVATDSIASTYRVARVHSSWTIMSIGLMCDALTGGAASCGLYRVAQDGGAVVAVAAYATGQSIATALTAPVNIAYQSRSIANCQRQVWQDAGLAADPSIFYDLVLTLTAAPTVAGNIVVDVHYIGNE